MGTWGPGNFDNDSANDYIDEFSQEMIDKIEGCFATEDGYSLDEGGEGVLMPTVEILSVLCERCSGLPPEPEVVVRWKQAYLTNYDDQVDNLEPTPEYKIARRQVIEETFGKLEEQARTFADAVSKL